MPREIIRKYFLVGILIHVTQCTAVLLISIKSGNAIKLQLMKNHVGERQMKYKHHKEKKARGN